MSKNEKILLGVGIALVLVLLSVLVWQGRVIKESQEAELGTWQDLDTTNSAPATTTMAILTHSGTTATSTIIISDERTEKLGFDVIVQASTSLPTLESTFPTLEWRYEFGDRVGTGNFFEDLFVTSSSSATTSVLSQSGRIYKWHPTSSTTKMTVINYQTGTSSVVSHATGTVWYFRIPEIDVLGRRVKVTFSNPSTTTPFGLWYSAIKVRESR